jgi:hypothetical protein
MMAGSAGMAICELIIGIIVAKCSYDWTQNAAAGWVAVGKSPRPNESITNLTSHSIRLAIHHQLRIQLGPGILDSDRRNLPHLHPRKGDIHRCLRELDEQLHHRICRTAYA